MWDSTPRSQSLRGLFAFCLPPLGFWPNIQFPVFVHCDKSETHRSFLISSAQSEQVLSLFRWFSFPGPSSNHWKLGVIHIGERLRGVDIVRGVTTSRNHGAGTSHDMTANLSTSVPKHLPYVLLDNIDLATFPSSQKSGFLYLYNTTLFVTQYVFSFCSDCPTWVTASMWRDWGWFGSQ